MYIAPDRTTHFHRPYVVGGFLVLCGSRALPYIDIYVYSNHSKIIHTLIYAWPT